MSLKGSEKWASRSWSTQKVLLFKVTSVIFRDINAVSESPLECALYCSFYTTLSFLSQNISNFSLLFQDLSVYFVTPMSRGVPWSFWDKKTKSKLKSRTETLRCHWNIFFSAKNRLVGWLWVIQQTETEVNPTFNWLLGFTRRFHYLFYYHRSLS